MRTIVMPFLVALVALPLAAADRPAPGTAKGTLTWEGKTITLANAATFVDQTDDRKPVILLLTDQKVPVEKWKSEFDLIGYRPTTKPRFQGIGFWFDRDRQDFRTQLYVGDDPTAVSGYFHVKLDPGTGFSGVVSSDPGDKKKGVVLDATFTAAK